MKKIDKIIAHVEDWVVCLLIFSMIVIIVLQVLSRNVLSSPLSATEECCRVGLVWLGFIAAAVAHRKSDHIVVTTFASYFPVKINAWLGLFVHIVSAAFFIFMIIYGIQLASQQFVSKLPALKLPYAIMTIPIAVSGFLMLYHTARMVCVWKPEFREEAAAK